MVAQGFLAKQQLTVPVQEVIDYDFYPKVPWISLELTSHCNLKCPYCANPVLTRQKGFIEWEILEKIVDESANGHHRINCLHGVGEPLLLKNLEDIVRLIRSKDAGIATFATNGTLLTEDRVRGLLDAGLPQIYISLDSLDPAVYRSTRGGDVHRVVKNVQNMIKMVPDTFTVYIGLMNHKDQNLSQENFNLFYETFGDRPNVVLDKVENLLFPSAPADYRIVQEKYDSCFRPANFLFIAYDGRAGICCVDQDVQYELGDVKTQTIDEIWFSRKNQTVFRNVAAGIFSCPDICTKNCILKEPKPAPEEISIGYGLPVEAAFEIAKQLFEQGEAETARRICSELKQRMPWDNQEILAYLGEGWSFIK